MLDNVNDLTEWDKSIISRYKPLIAPCDALNKAVKKAGRAPSPVRWLSFNRIAVPLDKALHMLAPETHKPHQRNRWSP